MTAPTPTARQLPTAAPPAHDQGSPPIAAPRQHLPTAPPIIPQVIPGKQISPIHIVLPPNYGVICQNPLGGHLQFFKFRGSFLLGGHL